MISRNHPYKIEELMHPECVISFKTLLEMVREILEERRFQVELFMAPIKALASAFGCDVQEVQGKKSAPKTKCNSISKEEKDADNQAMMKDFMRVIHEEKLSG